MSSQTPFPLMPSKSTELRLDHFDEEVYKADSSTLLYRLLDAMCGDSGAGSLKKELFLQRLSGAISGIYGSDLDYIFGNVRFLSRSPSETYSYNPEKDMLNSDQWDEVRVKDAWYRARITEYFKAANSGGTTDGIRMAVHAATSADCDVFETWRYVDEFGLGEHVGRTGHSHRNEVTVRPHKAGLSARESRTLRNMLDKITPQDCIPTIDEQGLSVSAPVAIRAVSADSTYFEVQKRVTRTPLLDDMPPPELLAIDLDPTEKWLFSESPELAPYAQFNITQEYGYYYLIGGGARSPIDAVLYGTLQDDGTVRTEESFAVYETSGQFTDWIPYERADSPDNYPGGKNGQHPTTAPAIDASGQEYRFPYASQQEYVDAKRNEVLTQGGIADDARYRLPIQRETVSKRTYAPNYAIAYSPPVKDSSITSSWTSRKPRQARENARDSTGFVRS